MIVPRWRIRKLQPALQVSFPGFFRFVAVRIEAHDSYTWRHSERVARIAVRLGRRMGLPRAVLSDLFAAALLHDIGKLGVPDRILQKQGALTDAEFDKVKMHPAIGVALLNHVDALSYLCPIVRHHHERYDGLGYPDGLAGRQIPLLARILAVADSFDAMNSDRPYQKAFPRDQIQRRLLDGSGKTWDPQVVCAFLACRDEIHAIGDRGFGDSVKLAVQGIRNKNARIPMPLALSTRLRPRDCN